MDLLADNRYHKYVTKKTRAIQQCIILKEFFRSCRTKQLHLIVLRVQFIRFECEKDSKTGLSGQQEWEIFIY